MKNAPFKNVNILIWSLNPDKLMLFYKNTFGLPYLGKTDIKAHDGLEKDYGYEFTLTDKGVTVWVGHHPKVKAKNTDIYRFINNLRTDEVGKWYKRLVKKKVRIIQKPIRTPFHTPKEPWYVCTFCDPEGNMWQLMGKL